jgi:tetratricopeptide (TPR) repeat protein
MSEPTSSPAASPLADDLDLSPDENEQQQAELAEAAAIEAGDEDDTQQTDTNRFPPLAPEALEQLRKADAAHIGKYDGLVNEALNAFFNNDFAHAENLLEKTYKLDPLAASAYGTLGSIRAMLSFDIKDINEASNRLVYSAAFGNGVQPKGDGLVGGVVSWWKGTRSDRLTPAQIRGLVVVGESELLRANVLLITDTFSGYIKAGLALRRGYAIYDRLLKYISKYDKDHGADANSVGGIHFGIGSIHLVTSILPPKLLALLRALGYMHDRALGFEHLNKCLHSKTLRSPIASLLLLAFHGILPSFAPLTIERNIPLADVVIKATLAMFPDSIIHLWLSGRVERIKKHNSGAIATFENCVGQSAKLRDALPQLEHFALYDLAWSYTARADWQHALACFSQLEHESQWSKMFYTYAQGACFDMMAVDVALACDAAGDADDAGKIRLLFCDPLGVALEEEDDVAAMQAEDEVLMDSAAAAHFAAVTLADLHDASKRSTPEFDALSFFQRVRLLRGLARRCFQRAIGYNSIKVGGKVISVEQFCKRRLKHKLKFDSTDGQRQLGTEIATGKLDSAKGTAREAMTTLSLEVTNAAPAPRKHAQDTCALRLVTGLELAMHFNVFPSCEAEPLGRHLLYCDYFDTVAMSDAGAEDVAVSQLIRATLVRCQGKHDDAAELYDELLDMKQFTDEKFVQPYALYEQGVSQYQQGDEEAAKETLSKKMYKRFGGKDYNFEMQMAFRLHLTGDMFKHEGIARAAEAKAGAQ